MPVARMEEFWVEQERYQEERNKIAGKDAKDATKVKATERRPWALEEQDFGIRQKEQKSRKKKEEDYTRFTKISKRCCKIGKYAKHVMDIIHGAPDAHRTSYETHMV